MDNGKKNQAKNPKTGDLSDLEVSVNEFGEIVYNHPLKDINKHLDANVPDKKFVQSEEE